MTPDWLHGEQINAHSTDHRQFIDFRASTLSNGSRIIDAHNSSGLTFSLLPDRGLDVWAAHYNGKSLTWLAQGSPYPPDNGQPWLRQFNGGLLVTCGLTHAGPPETDAISGEQRDLHGRYTRLIAHHVTQEADTDTLRLTGEMAQAALFGEQLHLTRTYTLKLGEPGFTVTDSITNRGDLTTPLMVLYHCNLGYPLVRAGTELLTTGDFQPRDEAARVGVETWSRWDAPTPQYAEQVFFHRVKHTGDGSTQVALVNDDFGLAWHWNTEELPYLTQWKNTRQGIYVSGVEPGNCLPEGQNAARESGRLQYIEPGETRTFTLTLKMLDGPDAISAFREGLAALERDGSTSTVALP